METYPSVCVGNKPGDFQRDLWTFSVVIVVSQTDYFSLEALTSLSMVVAIKAGILSLAWFRYFPKPSQLVLVPKHK